MLTPLVESPVENVAPDAAVLAHRGPARRPSIAEGEAIGSYELVELMGRGGMGEVWRARHRRLARGAAIKFVRPERLGGGGHEDAVRTVHQFEREAQATASLSSPYTIRLFDFGTTGEGAFYYAMELLEGRDLDALVREYGPLPAARVVYLLEQICRSLADAHACGLVHGDIKPANIHACRMGIEHDFVKVLDFGLVKREDRALEDTLVTAQQMTSGTPGYMAPEVILGDGSVDRRADIYALGCVATFCDRSAGVRRRQLDAEALAAPPGRSRAAVAADRPGHSRLDRRPGAGVPAERSGPAAAGRGRGPAPDRRRHRRGCLDPAPGEGMVGGAPPRADRGGRTDGVADRPHLT